MWATFLGQVEADIAHHGYWGGEANIPRDALGLRRLSIAAGHRIIRLLWEAGYECELEFEPFELKYESELLMIRRTGGRELVKMIEDLLPAIREADRIVPASATWRDMSVASFAMRQWEGARTLRSGGVPPVRRRH